MMRTPLLAGLLFSLAVAMAAAGNHHHHEVEIRQASSSPLATSRPSPSPGRPSSASVTVPSTVEDGIQTECKTCPYKLCTNIAAYEYGRETNLTCWTEGDKIVDTTTWFKTVDNCYVTEWDLVEGNYTDVLSYCGKMEPTYTTGPSKTVFNTECNIIPEFVQEEEDHTKMYQPEVDLTLTCYTTEGEAVLGNSQWYKTLSNCYVPAAEIEAVDASLDDCGPIPFMEAKMRQPDPEPSGATQPVPLTSATAFGQVILPSATTKSTTSTLLSSSPSSSATSFSASSSVSRLPARQASKRSDMSKRWLYITQIGDDFADCLSKPDSSSSVVQRYLYGIYVIVQCAGYSENTEDDNQIYLFTQDSCWINDTLTDPQLIDDEQRSESYPSCKLFVDT